MGASFGRVLSIVSIIDWDIMGQATSPGLIIIVIINDPARQSYRTQPRSGALSTRLRHIGG